MERQDAIGILDTRIRRISWCVRTLSTSTSYPDTLVDSGEYGVQSCSTCMKVHGEEHHAGTVSMHSPYASSVCTITLCSSSS